jgi:hypothetical protein
MKKIFAVVAASLLAACSSHSNIMPGAAVPSQKSSVSIRIVIRQKSTSSSSQRRSPQYISASTQSMSATITPTAGCTTCGTATTVNATLTNHSQGCQQQSGTLVCSVDVALNPGTYTGSMSLYDGPIDASNNPTGSLLSENQSFPVDVVANQANVVPLTLSGVPHRFILASNGYFTYAASSHTYRIPGPSVSNTSTIVAGDADGNYILGPGSPTYSATFTNPGNAWTASLSGSKLNVSLPPNTISAPSLQVAITASSPACSAAGAVCSTTFNIGPSQLLAIPQKVNNQVILVWEGLPLSTILSNGITSPKAVAFDPSANLYVLNGNDTVTIYAYPFSNTAPAYTLSTGISGGDALAVGSVKDVFVANFSTNNVAVFAPPYGSPGFITTGLVHPTSLALDSTSGELFVGEQLGGKILGFVSPYVATTATDTITNGVPSPTMLLATNGALYTSNGIDVVKYVSPYGGAAPALDITSSASAPITFVTGLARTTSDIVVTDSTSHAVTFFNASTGAVDGRLSSANGIMNPNSAVTDHDQNVLTCDDAYGSIYIIPPPYVSKSTVHNFGSYGCEPLAISP